jgi:hypothetical protein
MATANETASACLENDEKELFTLHPSWSAYTLQLILCGLLFLCIIVLLLISLSSWNPRSLANDPIFEISTLRILLPIFILSYFLTWFDRRCTVYTITSNRIILKTSTAMRGLIVAIIFICMSIWTGFYIIGILGGAVVGWFLTRKKTTEVWVSDIRGVQMEVGPWERLFGGATLLISSAAFTAGVIKMKSLPNAQHILDEINRLRKQQK